MATLKEHQATMVDLLANGNGIPASASRLAHAMHDVLTVLTKGPTYNLLACKPDEMPVNVWLNGDWDEAVRRERLARPDATTPGLNDKALSKHEKALKTDSPARWPTPAEQRVKELENTIKQLKANNAKLKQERDNNYAMWQNEINRKPDAQVCEHRQTFATLDGDTRCIECGEIVK